MATRLSTEQKIEMHWEVAQELAAGNVPVCPECCSNLHISLVGIKRGGPAFGCDCGAEFGTGMCEYPA